MASKSCRRMNKTLVQKQGLSSEVLAVILQHPAVAANLRNICTLLQVCRAWRAAVQQSSSGLINVTYEWNGSVSQLPRLSTFAGWLAKNFSMVSQLSISHHHICSSHQADAAALLETAKHILQFGMQTAFAAAASGSGAAPRLQSYNSTIPATAPVLAAFPAATLTQLTVSIDSSTCPAMLGKLSNLQRLSMALLQKDTIDSCLRQIGRLQQLTQLSMCNVAAKGDMRLLPAQLQRLELEYHADFRGATNVTAALADLQHLSCLRQLKLEAGRLTAGSSLPSNLLALNLKARFPAEGLTGFASLHQVTSMVLDNCELRRSHIRELEQLPKLLHLSMDIRMQPDARPMEAAVSWQRLPLCVLRVAANVATAGELQQIMPHIAVATTLSELHFCISEVVGAEPPGLEICEYLKPLQQLKSLDLCVGQPRQFALRDAEHLSALTALTSLDLCYNDCGPFVDASTVSLLSVSLTQLRELFIGVDSDPDSTVCRASIPALPVLGKLTTLETLSLAPLPRLEALRGLQFLTGPSRLKTLSGFYEAGTEAVSAFWTALRSQHVRR